MKKHCPQCDSIFFGRSDKLFCSVSCKNQFHNTQRKNNIAYTVDQSLHANRSILNMLISEDSQQTGWDRKVLDKLGFNFQVFTGILVQPDGKFKYRVYEFAWSEEQDDLIMLERYTMEMETA